MRYPKVQAAIEFAVARHSGADRDGADALPYVVHPIEVLAVARTVGGIHDEDTLTAAVLHDTIEETSTTREEIAGIFGERVAVLVQALTRREPSDEERAGKTKEEIWQMRSAMLLDEIAKMPPDVLPLKLADRLSNVREAKLTKSKPKLARYLDQTKKILGIVPRTANPCLWDAIETELSS